MQQLDNQTNSAALVIETVLLGMRTIRAQMRGGLPVDVSIPQFRVLAYLARKEGASLSDVAEHIGLTLPSMSRAIDYLVNRGFVTREAASDDRRRVVLALTADGRSVYEAAHEATRARITEMFSCLLPDELSTVQDAMHILNEIFSSSCSRQSNRGKK